MRNALSGGRARRGLAVLATSGLLGLAGAVAGGALPASAAQDPPPHPWLTASTAQDPDPNPWLTASTVQDPDPNPWLTASTVQDPDPNPWVPLA